MTEEEKAEDPLWILHEMDRIKAESGCCAKRGCWFVLIWIIIGILLSL
jgi:hypothetical protein